MDNVIYAAFGNNDNNSGYLMERSDNGKEKITGVYAGDIAAALVGDDVYLGTKADQSIHRPVWTNMKDINDFCIMWLCIFSPDVIAEDKD